jgi:hypothetical protein
MSKQISDRGLQKSSTRPESDAERPSTPFGHFYHYSQQGMPTSLTEVSPTMTKPPQPRPSIQLPPLPQGTNVTLGSFSPPYFAGLPPILTPSTEQKKLYGQRCKADQLDSLPWSDTSLPSLITGAQPGRPEIVSDRPSKLHGSAPQPTLNRPTLIPRSPAFQRPAAYQSVHPPTGTVAALKPPFLTSPQTRSYATEPGVRNFPTPPASHRPTYEYAVPLGDRTIAPRRASVGASHLTPAPSSSGSSSTPYSSSSQAGRLDERQRLVGIPISSASGQTVYQMMTLETTSGSVQLPVDVQAASKVADEKRKRNAGASVRFRQRRKEKEREWSNTISKLQQRLEATADDAGFYKHERDYLASVILQVPGGDRHIPRPQAPRYRRSSIVASASESVVYLSGPEQCVSRDPEQGRNVHRRDSIHSLPSPPPPPVPIGPPSAPSLAGAVCKNDSHVEGWYSGGLVQNLR